MTDQCKACSADVMWVQMATGGKMLINLPPEKRVVLDHLDTALGPPVGHIVDTYTSHFATCPKADQFRRKHEN